MYSEGPLSHRHISLVCDKELRLLSILAPYGLNKLWLGKLSLLGFTRHLFFVSAYQSQHLQEERVVFCLRHTAFCAAQYGGVKDDQEPNAPGQEEGAEEGPGRSESDRMMCNHALAHY